MDFKLTRTTSFIIIIYALILCELNNGKGSGVGLTTEIVSLIVAIIGVIGVILADVIRSSKQGKAIDDKVNSVKGDTGTMAPKIDNINDNSRKVRDVLLERLLPTIESEKHGNTIMSSQLQELYDDMKYHKELKKELIDNGKSKDYFIDGINVLYQQNELLSAENRDLRCDIAEKRETIAALELKIENLQTENRDLKARIAAYKAKTEFSRH
ncbi:MAG: hypothetical protein IJ168_10405 [Eubacterium sp.]|nr:hypothetical protein [Eubacterium sp.]